MKIAVIGGGAIGLLVSYFLKKKGLDPVVYTRTESQSLLLNQSGIHYMDCENQKETIAVTAKPIETFSGAEPFCVIAVKQTAIAELSFLKNLHSRTSLLFLQNGMGHIRFLKDLPQEQICVGVVEHGALKEGATTINHLGRGKIKIASFKGNDADEWCSLLELSNFPIFIEEEWRTMLVEKLIMNASINPVTAIFRIPNGALLENPYAHNMMKNIFEETVSVFRLENKKERLWKDLLALCRNTSKNRSSMLKSIESGQQTEIEAITGEVIRQAISQNRTIPHSQLAYEVLKGLDWRG